MSGTTLLKPLNSSKRDWRSPIRKMVCGLSFLLWLALLQTSLAVNVPGPNGTVVTQILSATSSNSEVKVVEDRDLGKILVYPPQPKEFTVEIIARIMYPDDQYLEKISTVMVGATGVTIESDEIRNSLILATLKVAPGASGGRFSITYENEDNPNHKGCNVRLLPVDIVPDYNRDGKITSVDRGKVSEENPFRWWINDDDDSGEIGKGKKISITKDEPIDVPGHGDTNHEDAVVNGLRDLVDFFPLHLDLKQVLETLPKDEYKYFIKHEDGAVKFYEITETVLEQDHDNKGPSAYLRNLAKAKSLASASLKHATSSGVELSGDVLDAFKKGEGILICEATKETDTPLILEIKKNDGTSLAEIEFPVKFSEVEKMYRHGNMRNQVSGGAGGLATKLQDRGDPYPDSLTNGNTFVFIHGFNVSGEAARGWHAEIFKRMHQMGSKARFVGISWHGDVSPDYHEAVKHAFMLSERLNAWLQVPGEITIAAHSLGNMVVSNAIEYEGFNPKRYYMINAATPIEAYDASQTSNADDNNMSLRMVENSWKPYDPRLYASNWHELFAVTAADGRNKLKWKDRFAGKVPDVAYNFYSTGEDVVENADAGESFLGNIVWHGFVRHAWVQNEIAKGNSSLAADLTLKDTHAGWRFYFQAPSRIQPGIGYYKFGFLGGKGRMYEPDETEEITSNQLKTKPFYWPFKYGDLYDATKGSAEADKKQVQYELLATAIPALSYAAAANSVTTISNKGGGNFNMMNLKNGGWPAVRGVEAEWHHSDFRDVAMSYTWKMYQEMIQQGKLDEE